jgi:predicted GNAT family acetyltransferase
MPRTHFRKPESRKYGYSEELMQRALTDVKENGLSIKSSFSAWTQQNNTNQPPEELSRW